MESKLTGVSETMLIPLWARAYETKREDSIVKDAKAIEIMNRIDYDFSKFEGAWMSQTGVAIRTKVLDDGVKHFINNHKDAIVINIGCGLDTRFERIDNGRVIWYDLDLKQAIDLRKNFFKETKRYKMISKSVFDYSWMDDIDFKNKNILVLSEGVLMYFKEEQIKELLDKMQKKFKKFECLFEIMTPFIVKNSKRHDSVNETNASFSWGIKGGKELEQYNSHLKFIEEWNFYDFYRNRWRFLRWLSLIPLVKNNFNNRVAHFKMA